MPGYWTKETETRALQDHLDEPMYIRLFINSVNVSRATALSSLVTINSGDLGYAPKEIGVGSWVVTSADPACLATAPQVLWTIMGSLGPVHGYYFTQANSDTYPMGCIERFSDGPYSMIRTGQQLSVTPVLGARGVTSYY
jgi:hypothetical protein